MIFKVDESNPSKDEPMLTKVSEKWDDSPKKLENTKQREKTLRVSLEFYLIGYHKGENLIDA